MTTPLPTPSTLREILAYDPESGLFTWLARQPHHFDEGSTFHAAEFRKITPRAEEIRAADAEFIRRLRERQDVPA